MGRHALASDLLDLFEARLAHVTNLDLVAAVAGASLRGNDIEAGKSLATADAVEQALLRYPLTRWNVLREAAAGSDERAVQAKAILTDLAKAVQAQEFTQSLSTSLAAADRARDTWLEAAVIVTPPPVVQPPVTPPPVIQPPATPPNNPDDIPLPPPAPTETFTVTGANATSAVEARLAALLANYPNDEFTVTITRVPR
ncbi:hypothetical protein P9209_23550 [Prescottella defluvii]|nr:hypothetical protein P9209_23550 [Prescottella defluvii]